MLNNLKPLVIILVLAWIVFRVARPICLAWMPQETFARRRNVWFALTVVAFLSPAFWIYALFALTLLGWATARDENPLALYALVTFAIPDVRYYIPGLLVQNLFDITQYRILSLAIVIPMIFRSMSEPWENFDRRLKLIDLLMIAFLALQVVLTIPYESATTTMRHSFLVVIDTFVVFYAFSRLKGRRQIADVIVCFWTAAAIMTPIALFEWAKHWLLYVDLAGGWGDPNEFAYLFRGDSLRAQAAANHSINLGYVLSMGLGFYMFLRSKRSVSRFVDLFILGGFCSAIFATGARGPWVTAMLVAAFFVLFQPGASRKIGAAVVVTVVAVAVMYLTPLKESVLDRLPLIGTADQETIEYRRQLAELSWSLILQNPLFGDPFVARNMESMRQGQGIIDIVNGYIFSALFFGLVGLTLQVMLFVLAIYRSASALFRIRHVDEEMGILGASLLATFVATLFYIATAGYGTTTYIIAGLLVSFATAVSRQVAGSGVGLPGRAIRVETKRPI